LVFYENNQFSVEQERYIVDSVLEQYIFKRIELDIRILGIRSALYRVVSVHNPPALIYNEPFHPAKTQISG
jgi:hypothetical protein